METASAATRWAQSPLRRSESECRCPVSSHSTFGATSLKIVLIGDYGHVYALQTSDLVYSRPRPGRAETRPEGFWREMARGVNAVLSDAGMAPSEIDAISLSSQGHTSVPVERAGAEGNPGPYRALNSYVPQLVIQNKLQPLETLARGVIAVEHDEPVPEHSAVCQDTAPGLIDPDALRDVFVLLIGLLVVEAYSVQVDMKEPPLQRRRLLNLPGNLTILRPRAA